MAKKITALSGKQKPVPKQPSPAPAASQAPPADQYKQLEEKLPKEMQERLEKIKGHIEEFKTKVMEKFDKYIVGISLLPPPQPKEGEQMTDEEKNLIHLLVLVDDSDSKTMSKQELQDKLFSIIEKMAKEVDKNLSPQTMILSDLWQQCSDGRYETVRLITLSAPVFDAGVLEALKVSEVHKEMVVKEFGKYISSYVISGSIMYGKFGVTSDIDVMVIVDDTDVKRMTRAELKDRLRAKIISLGIDAKQIAGCKREFHIQVYILTDFWESLKESHPVIIDLLRNGVPMHDRGMLVAWKQLLKMGRVKPSPEAIDMFKATGDQVMQRVSWKLVEIAMEDIYYATLTPMQAALMSYGILPPAPKQTPDLVREVFVQKEKLLEEEYAKILEDIIKKRKELEHNPKQTISGKEIDEELENAKRFLKRLDKLFKDIEERKEIGEMEHMSDTTVSIVRDILRLEGHERTKDLDELRLFEHKLVKTGKIPESMLRILKLVIKGKKDYDDGKLTKTEVAKVKKHFNEFTKFMVEYLQRKRGLELEKARIRVKAGETYGEVILLGKIAFIIHDLDQEDKTLSKADINARGGLSNVRSTTLEEMEKELAKQEIPPKVFLKEKIFEDLKGIFGGDVEVQVRF